MRYQRDSTNHKLYDPEIRQIIMTRDVTFNEKPRSMIKATTKEEDLRLNLKQVQQAPIEEEKPRAVDAILAVLDPQAEEAPGIARIPTVLKGMPSLFAT